MVQDIVLLQEVWVEGDAKYLQDCARLAGLTHSIHFKSGIFGSGLVTFSRYPLVEVGFHRYSASGSASAVLCGDFYAGKGCGWVVVEIEDYGRVALFNTHLHANYSHTYEHDGEQGGAMICPSDCFAPFRISQILELAQLVDLVASRCTGVVVGGDLNVKPRTMELELFKARLPWLTDTFADVHPGEDGHTCRAAGNTFKSYRQVPERIDYIWSNLPTLSCEITLTNTPLGMSYSDHFGVVAELSMELLPEGDDRTTPGPCSSRSYLIPSTEPILETLDNMVEDRKEALAAGSLVRRRRNVPVLGRTPDSGRPLERSDEDVAVTPYLSQALALCNTGQCKKAARQVLKSGVHACRRSGYKKVWGSLMLVVGWVLLTVIGMLWCWQQAPPPGVLGPLYVCKAPCWPSLWWVMSLVGLPVGVVAVIMFAMGFVGDLTQERVLRHNLESLEVWHEATGGKR